MRTRRQRVVVCVAVGIAVGWAGPVAAARPSKAQVCEASKLTAAGLKASCLAIEEAKGVLGGTPKPAWCSATFSKAFTRAEAIAGGVCPTQGDAAAIEAQIDACIGNLAAALSGETPPATHQFPATGQTTCWDSSNVATDCANTSGQDGNIRAGAALSYTDNLDGTITDNNTGLMWAKKDDNNVDPLLDKDTTYTWADALAVHIAGLNAGAGFAGFTVWRLPNVKELQSIINYENSDPAVSSAFNTGCAALCTVLTCSCTQTSTYWSSTTYVGSNLGPAYAWFIQFTDGYVWPTVKTNGTLFVRAVRGGL